MPQPASSKAARPIATPNVAGGKELPRKCDRSRRTHDEHGAGTSVTPQRRQAGIECTAIAWRSSCSAWGLHRLLALSWPARAALDIGERAPDFTTPAAMAGSVYSYALAGALKKGPVVLYFFPAAYSEGCSLEAHYFAEAIPQFEALGAT